MNYPLKKTEEEWKAKLGSERYRILRQKGTESPQPDKYNTHVEKGT